MPFVGRFCRGRPKARHNRRPVSPSGAQRGGERGSNKTVTGLMKRVIALPARPLVASTATTCGSSGSGQHDHTASPTISPTALLLTTMLARPSDGQLARRQPFASTSGPASTSASPMRSSTQPTSGGSASSATSLNIRPARLVGSEGTAYEAMCKVRRRSCRSSSMPLPLPYLTVLLLCNLQRVLSRRLLRAFSLAFFTTLAIWSTSLSLTGASGHSARC
jgi:hypothetical protein